MEDQSPQAPEGTSGPTDPVLPFRPPFSWILTPSLVLVVTSLVGVFTSLDDGPFAPFVFVAIQSVAVIALFAVAFLDLRFERALKKSQTKTPGTEAE